MATTMSAIEKCLVLIKPDGISRGLMPIIISDIKRSGLKIEKQKFLTASEKQCRQHFQVKAQNYGATEKQIVEYLSRSYIKNGGICVLVVSGVNAVLKALKIKTKIRNAFGIDTREICKAEGRALHNLMHSSESADDAKKEIRIWLRDGKPVVDWTSIYSTFSNLKTRKNIFLKQL
jgi:nucleoside-diphosphate kinase